MAPFYIYRNLQRGGYSVQQRGKVVDYIDSDTSAILHHVVPVIREAGRKKAMKEKVRNVHSFLRCDFYQKYPHARIAKGMGKVYKYNRAISYSPFDERAWHYKDDNSPYTGGERVLLHGKKVLDAGV